MKEFLQKNYAELLLSFLLIFVLYSSCGCVTTESSRQTGDYIYKGAVVIDKATPKDSKLKPTTKAMVKLTKAHSKKELGAPKEPLADDWDPVVANKKADEIDADYATWGVWLGALGLGLFTVSRLLKSVGVYLPKAWLKDAAATLFNKPVEPPQRDEDIVEPSKKDSPVEPVKRPDSIIKDMANDKKA